MAKSKQLATGAGVPDPTDERRFLNLVRNHGEMRRLLTNLTMVKDLNVLQQHVASVSSCWLRLGEDHLAEARAAAKAHLTRASYSRSYYAAYNASKAVRFVVNGSVSRRGDDHQAVSDLPDKFPNVDSWTARLAEMYKHRLLADYDNWRDSAKERTLTPEEMVQNAEDFIGDCRKYLKDECGVTP
jgi:sulfur relay (sulfurtransferase) DsrC/TusE family protein